MPSEGRVDAALKALSDAKESFLSSVALSIEEVRGILERAGNGARGPADALAQELGPFAKEHIDIERLAAFVGPQEGVTPERREAIEKALAKLRALKEAGDEIFRTRVALDGYVRGEIMSALGRAGTAFGAARSVEWALHAIAPPEGVEDALETFPPHLWNPAERGCAPPLVVEVAGQDLKVASLADLLEGSQKIILVVEGPAAPAPLVRLITPGVAVVQTQDPADLAVVGQWEGPGIGALMPDGAAVFTHSPAAGPRLNDRLKVTSLPEKEPRRALGSISAFQQREELRQLAALAASVEKAVPEATESPEEATALDEAGQLAAWLIQKAGV